jgi:4-hydroxy-3-polyprenylbenzoate decarboxylase
LAEKAKNFQEKPIVVAVTGASGTAYAIGLLGELGRREIPVNLIASQMGRDMLKCEAGIPLEGSLVEHLAAWGIDTRNFQGYDVDNLSAPPASGSYPARAMVVCPCSMKTLSAVAVGSCRTLIERAAEVMLKERRKLILVVRESPYSLVQIENMRSATLAGALILPASPAFYHHPGKIDDLVDFIVARILDQLEIPHDLLKPWGGKN